MSDKSLREELENIKNLIEKFELEVKRDQFNVTNVDEFIKKTRDLLKQVFSSHVYN